MGSELAQYFHHVDVWCKNDEYPPLIEIDQRLVEPSRPFKFEDLYKMLPEGMWLHRKYDRMFGNSIASMGENFNHILCSTLFPAEDDEEDQEELFGIKPEKYEQIIQNQQNLNVVKKKKIPLQMPILAASSKKLMQLKSEGSDAKAIRKLMKKAVEKAPKPKK